MNLILETDRLLLRPFEKSDAAELFDMDKNPNVHKYLWLKPVESIDEVYAYIEMVQKQYQENGIGRFATILKDNNEFIGWTGIKFVNDHVENGNTNFYDYGYRLNPKFWGKGYATEAGLAFVDFVFNEIKADALYAYADSGNLDSRHIMEKIGMRYVNSFEYEGEEHVWYTQENPNL